ncbi:hypothetical protein M404DRAFT_997663 [Pisolithus tinctorius Marx 270]|uniref:Uncharacterized protein n=1 Tax=Pisolithus tinctorius Marx 270 TaxID=870435 RepID=A0A0C3PHN9_PISTI|nr:hypothetical protein M404DRAFT_997663 [Pisolithus tinctorius Marx 270]
MGPQFSRHVRRPVRWQRRCSRFANTLSLPLEAAPQVKRPPLRPGPIPVVADVEDSEGNA